jgi:hypothetical protein
MGHPQRPERQHDLFDLVVNVSPFGKAWMCAARFNSRCLPATGRKRMVIDLNQRLYPLFRLYHRDKVRFAARLVGSRDNGKDVIQDACLKRVARQAVDAKVSTCHDRAPFCLGRSTGPAGVGIMTATRDPSRPSDHLHDALSVGHSGGG